MSKLAEIMAEGVDNQAVENLAHAMKDKLAKKRKQGYHGWTSAQPEHLSNLLVEHVAKGDPVDVANFCAFLFARDELIVKGTVKEFRDWLIAQYPLSKQELVDLMGRTSSSGASAQRRQSDPMATTLAHCINLVDEAFGDGDESATDTV